MKNHVCGVVAALALIAAGQAWSQKYPTRPIRIIVPFTAGSQTDVFARIIAPKMAEYWGQQVVVDNRPSAGGIVAGTIISGAAPDGYTLMLTSSAYAVSASIYSKLPYDPLKDIDGVAKFASVALVLVVSPKLGVKSVKELIALAKQKPGQINFGSAGIGSATHMGGEQFKYIAKLDVVHIPYRGTPEALVDTVTGRIQYWFSPLGPAVPFVQDGRLLALAVTTAQRSPLFPNAPTIAEAAIPGFDYDPWYAVFTAAKTPRPVVNQINKELARVLALPDVKERMQFQGAVLGVTTPEEFAKLLRNDIATLKKIAQAANVRID
ncbi:MAG: tripartite tricarboxylate transporter substrate binding protein [Burkholderiales bacterium]